MTVSSLSEPGRARTIGATGPVLTVDGLHITVSGGRAEAVRDVSFTVHAGEAVGVVGESGSGKTLTCRSLLGVLPPGCEVSAGSAVLAGADLDGTEAVGTATAGASAAGASAAGKASPASRSFGKASAAKSSARKSSGTASSAGTELTALDRRQWERLRGVELGAVFQDPASYLNPALTVGRQLAEPLRVRLGLKRARAHERAVELFASVGLRDPADVYHRYPHELSGGMLQRVLIAIAVACDPRLLVADEATTALDTVVQAEVLDLLAQLRDERGLALLLVTHDLAVVAEVTDRVLVFYAGEIVEDGPTQDVVHRPAHPYTAALLRVASLGDWNRRELAVIPGRPPEAGEAPVGCRFADRCAFAEDRCRTRPVPLTATADGRRVRCVRAAELALSPPPLQEVPA
ncbi:oligopeptide/dipeptide ABC transporter ATP-binding protein [Streptomyces sp. NPDC008139]|uniref:ABC transporter ATP-binding protein n=1 Tax=Streptomyces sp. NPDC008139 TaxID=3364814 RepID=UPI0036E69468